MRYLPTRIVEALLLLTPVVVFAQDLSQQTIHPTRVRDMRPMWNEHIALENPEQGGYHHYPDNHVSSLESGVAEIAPEHRGHSQFMSPLEGF